MIILAIETSCDDTGVAILKVNNGKDPKFEILSNVVSSQVELHKKYGGVFPSLAKREHEKNLPIVLKKSLKIAKNPKVDMIAVTHGPGLEPCLWVGVNFAKELAKKLEVPIIPVDHIEAHILVNFLEKTNSAQLKNKVFPAMCLIVSGGHTQLVLMKDYGKYKIIGETLDDAAGECFDKTARILGLEYPGGLTIAKMASEFKKANLQVKFPRPIIYQKNYNFSFSGLKTAVLYYVKKLNKKAIKDRGNIIEICHEIQQSILDVLIKKTIKAAEEYRAKSIIVGGGVSANTELRKQMKEESSKLNINFLAPPKNLSTDNAVMIAIAAYFNQKDQTKSWDKVEANANLRIA